MKGETPENAFSRIFSNSPLRKMHPFDWIILVNMQTLENIMFSRIYFPENASVQLLTPVNTLLFTRKIPMNERKTRCLPCVNRAVNAGK